jgi:hypothetical protein
MIKYHSTVDGLMVAEYLPGSGTVSDPADILDIMAEAGMNGCNSVVIHEKSLPPGFFDLKTGIAGEILQKFSNYRMKLAIMGDFSEIKSKSLSDFIRESNRGNRIFFIGSLEEALSRLED